MHNVIEAGLEDYLGGSPNREFQAHLAQCPSCHRQVKEIEQVSGLLIGLRSTEAIAPTLGFAPRLVRNVRAEENRSFWSIFTVDSAFTRKVAFGSLLSLAVLGSYLATSQGDEMTEVDHTPEAVMASHTHGSGSQQEHLNSMLVTLASYQE